MEQARLLIALALSFLVIFVWQFFFVDNEAKKTEPAPKTAQEQVRESEPAPLTSSPTTETASPQPTAESAILAPTTGEAQSITVDTPLYQVAINGKGAGFASFVLKKYREAAPKDAPLKELIRQKPALSR